MQSACECARVTCAVTSFRRSEELAAETLAKIGGEGRNRTHPPTQSVGAAALKAATTTRHVSLPGQMAGQDREIGRTKLRAKKPHYIDLTLLTIALKSGKSPVCSFEQNRFPFTPTSNAPRLDGIRVIDLISSLRAKSLSAGPTALGS